MPTPDYLAVGRVTRPHSVRGEVLIEILTDFADARFAPGSRLYLGDEAASAVTTVVVLSARGHKGALLVGLDIARDRSEAEALRGRFVFVQGAQAMALEPDTYYHYELIGCSVTTVAGRDLGEVVEVMETGSADVLVVRPDACARDALVPMIGDVIREIDVADRRITIEPLPGLLDDEPPGGVAGRGR